MKIVVLASLFVIGYAQIQAQVIRELTPVRRRVSNRRQNTPDPNYNSDNGSLLQAQPGLSNVQYLNVVPSQSNAPQRNSLTNEQTNQPNYNNNNIYQPVPYYNTNSYSPINEQELNQYGGLAPRPTIMRVTTTTEVPPVQPTYPETAYTNYPASRPLDQNQSPVYPSNPSIANPLASSSFPQQPQNQQYQPAGSRQPGLSPAPGANRNLNKYEFITHFSWRLFQNSKRQLATMSNIVVSPLSVQLLLSLIEQAAAGITKHQLRTIIGNSNPVDIGQAIDQITFLRMKTKLKIGTALFPSQRLTLNETFQNIAQDSFVDIIPVDYRDQARTRRTINSWASSSTGNKITNIFSGSQTSADLILTNAVYFEGFWKYPFNQTIDDRFYQGPNIQKQITYLKQTSHLRYGSKNYFGIKINWVELPYENEDFSMLILLPNEFKLDELIDRMTDNFFTSFLTDLEVGEKWRVHLRLPKFEMKIQVPLKSIMQSMGIVNVFTDQADIPYLAREKVKIDDAQQDVYLSVDEKGTTAAAVTTFSVITLSSSSYEPEETSFDVNQPFLAVILHKQTRLPIFIAQIFDP